MNSKFRTELADGRELIYFDDQPGKPHGGSDRRPLDARGGFSELRFDELQGEWVIVASHRQTRTHLPKSDECPLCPSTASYSTEIPESDYDVVVFENRFPSLASAGLDAPAFSPQAFASTRPGIGRCEVVCFSSDHEAAFSRLSDARLRTLGHAWADRTRELGRLPGVEYVFCFENRGEEIGVTLHHPHGQIYAYPFLPPKVRRSLEAAYRFRERSGKCLGCSLLHNELADGRRIVSESEHFVAYVPFAARWPFEIHLAARRHAPDLPSLNPSELEDALRLQANVLRQLDAVFGVNMPYIASWAQAPVALGRELSHLRLEIVSLRRAPNKLKYLAGSESAAGVFINDVVPEEAARLLRETIAPPIEPPQVLRAKP